MKIEKFGIGDRFYNEFDACFVEVKDIRCGVNVEKNRWETEVVYDDCTVGFMNPDRVLPAADFVMLIRDGDFNQHIARGA
jgi:hypothetical protein